MAEVPGKPTASSFSAGLPTSQGLSPLQWSDKCFLCGNMIGETDPRGFYQGTNAMLLCHRGCLNVMNAHGGQPQDYHRAVSGESAPAAREETGGERSGPHWLDFPDLAGMQAYIRASGDISSTVTLTVAGKTIQG